MNALPYAPSDRSLFAYEWYAGAIAKGLIDAPPADTLGLIVMSGKVSPHVARRQGLGQKLDEPIAVQRTETAVELNYDVVFAKWLHIMPGS